MKKIKVHIDQCYINHTDRKVLVFTNKSKRKIFKTYNLNEVEFDGM